MNMYNTIKNDAERAHTTGDEITFRTLSSVISDMEVMVKEGENVSDDMCVIAVRKTIEGLMNFRNLIKKRGLTPTIQNEEIKVLERYLSN
jgi:hypothetical protein